MKNWVVVVGGTNMDVVARTSAPLVPATSNPGHTRISPGGVGYDINCGVRLLRTDLDWAEVKDRVRPLVDQLFRDIPTGVGQTGRYLFDKPKLKRLMEQGSAYVVNQGWGTPRDIEFTEAGGRLDGADPDRVSDRAITRGYDQCGTLGSGNHFLEVQVVDRVIDERLRDEDPGGVSR